MLFTDPVFIFFFLPLSVIVTHFLATRAGKTVMLLSIILFSSVFYGLWGLDYLLILASSVLVNWTTASYLLSSNGMNVFWRRVALYLGQAFNILLLIWFKYSFYIAFLYGETAEIRIENIAIPVGISFYTFQQAVFLQECFHRDSLVIRYIWRTNNFIDRVRSFIRYTAFITFFPQLVIGPIVYLSEFAPQTARKTFGIIRRRNVEIGSFFIILGLFKKVVIADNIGIIIDPVFERAELGADIGALAAWSASLGYYTQLYFDFSGYSEIATGTARLFGLILPINFDSPLKAVSISDFYRRWHITLTRVISRFLYTPLSVFGLRKSNNPNSARFHLLAIWIPLLINFTAIAIWHGLSTTFLLFGLLHAIWYIIEIETGQTKLWKLWKRRTSEVTRANIGRAVFFLPMVCCFALFRSESVEGWIHIIIEMFDFSKIKMSYQTLLEFGCIFMAWNFCILLPNAYDLTKEYTSGLKTYKNPAVSNIMPTLRWRPNLFWGLIVATALIMVIYNIGRLPPFLYLGF